MVVLVRSRMRRNLRLIVPWAPFERNKVELEAKEADLNTTDFVRLKLGLEQIRKTRTVKTKTESPLGDPDNAVDVEELARQIWGFENALAHGDEEMPMTMVDARREAKRRLEEAQKG